MQTSTLRFGDVMARDRLELICKFLHLANSEAMSSFQGPKKWDIMPCSPLKVR
jgi:hypothetical protein